MAAENFGVTKKTVTLPPETLNSSVPSSEDLSATGAPSTRRTSARFDTIVLPHAFDSLVRFMDEHPKVGIAGSRLEDEQGLIALAELRVKAARRAEVFASKEAPDLYLDAVEAASAAMAARRPPECGPPPPEEAETRTVYNDAVAGFLEHPEEYRHKPADLDVRPSEQILDELCRLIAAPAGRDRLVQGEPRLRHGVDAGVDLHPQRPTWQRLDRAAAAAARSHPILLPQAYEARPAIAMSAAVGRLAQRQRPW